MDMDPVADAFGIGLRGEAGPRSQDAGDLAYNATAASVQSALEALPGVGAGKVTVTGAAGGPYTVVIDGSLPGVLTVDGTNLVPTGTVTVN